MSFHFFNVQRGHAQAWIASCLAPLTATPKTALILSRPDLKK
jgi:hypothetical protein